MYYAPQSSNQNLGIQNYLLGTHSVAVLKYFIALTQGQILSLEVIVNITRKRQQ